MPSGGATPPKRDPHASPPVEANLTPREREVAALLGRGLGYKEIALRLAISANTVNNHLANIRAKLHARNSIEALNRLSGRYGPPPADPPTGELPWRQPGLSPPPFPATGTPFTMGA